MTTEICTNFKVICYIFAENTKLCGVMVLSSDKNGEQTVGEFEEGKTIPFIGFYPV